MSRRARPVFHGLLPLLLLACPAFLAAQRPLGDAFLVNQPAQVNNFTPHLATNASGEFVVVWIAQSAGSGPITLYARKFAADGRPAIGAIRVASDNTLGRIGAGGRTNVAILADGSFVVAFPRDSGHGHQVLMTRWFRPDGTPDDEFVVTREDVSDVLLAARADGGLAMTWETPNGNLWVRAYGPDHAPLAPALLLQRYSGWPALASSAEGSFVVAWQSDDFGSASTGPAQVINARTFAADGSPRGQIRIAKPDYGADFDTSSVVLTGMDGDGNFLVVWAGNSVFHDTPTFARRFRSDGTPLGGIVRLDLGGTRFEPSSLAMGGQGNFVVTWEQPKPASAFGLAVFVRRFAADGAPLGPALRVDPAAPNERSNEQAGIGVDGEIIVAWEGTSTGRPQIYARRFQRR